MMAIKEFTMTGTKKCAGAQFSIFFTVALICLMMAGIIPGVNGASPIDLGAAGNFAILAKSGITTTGATSINGNIGVSPITASSMTGFALVADASNQFSTSSLVSGRVYAANYAPPTPATMTSAVSAMEAAYTNAGGQAPSNVAELYAGNLGGRTLAPGVYKWSTGLLIPSATTLTLDAQGNSGAVWIFQVAGDVTMDSASQVALANGANAENVYWQVAGPTGVTIGSGAHAEGTILAQKAIVLRDGASLHGRALAQTAVTLIANTVTAPTTSYNPPVSATATPTLAPGQTATPTLAPGQTATPTLAPGQTATPTLAPGQTATPTLAPSQIYEVIPTSAANATKITVPVNVGGTTDITKVDVIGTGNNNLIVTSTDENDAGPNMDAPPGTVYEYTRIIPTRYTTIDGVVISFSVRRQWLEEKKISPGNVVLYHLNGTVWTALPTSVVTMEDAKIDYRATSPSFSLFAITGQTYTVPASAQTPTTQITYVNAQTSVATPVYTMAQPTPLPTKSPFPVWIPVIAVIGALLMAGVISCRGRKNS